MRLLATNRTRNAAPIIVALILGGAVRETRDRNGGQKYMKPTPCTAQNRNGQTHKTRPDESAIAATRMRWAPPQMKAPTPILRSSEGSPPRPRPRQAHRRNSSGTQRMLNKGSIDWNQGMGIWNPPAFILPCCSSQTGS